MKIEDLHFSYGDHEVLKGVSYSAELGEFISVLGPNGVGKSTLFRCMLGLLEPTGGSVTIGGRDIQTMTAAELSRHVAYIPQPLFGFETKKEDGLADEVNGSPVYIYNAGCEHLQREDNLVGYCKNQNSATLKAAFDRYAPRLMGKVPEGSVIELDEIGFMEAKSEAFCGAVLSLLDGDVPVIAAVKDKDIPFLQTVRAHPKAKCFHITSENRDAFYLEVLGFMKAQLEEV